MSNDKEEIRLDKTGTRPANEPGMPGDNTVKKTDVSRLDKDPASSSDNTRITPDLEGTPDFANDETEGNTGGGA